MLEKENKQKESGPKTIKMTFVSEKSMNLQIFENDGENRADFSHGLVC